MKNAVLRTVGVGCALVLLGACGGGGGGGSGSGSIDYTVNDTNTSYKVTPTETRYTTEVQKVMDETNKLRAAQGLPALKYDANLAAYAQQRAAEIVKRFDHTRPDGRSWSSGIQGGGGENIVAGTENAAKSVAQWQNSPEHYKNMIDSSYTKIGIGMVYVPNSEYGYYWVQIFGMDNTTSRYSFTNANTTSNTVSNTTSASPLTEVVIDGIRIPLTAIDGSGSWYEIQGNGYAGVINGYNATRFGAIKLSNDNKYHTFHQGVATAESDMPTSGSARYTGRAVVVEPDHSARSLTSAQFNADFSNKKLSGQLGTGLKMEANIHGNQFNSATGATVETQGGFYGSKAAELSGEFKDNASGKTGAFGAKKQ